MNEKEFVEKYCGLCGTQRCEGIHSEWFEGCKYRWNLEGKDPASEIMRLEKQVLDLASKLAKAQSYNEEHIKKIIEKVREVGKYNPDISDIVKRNAHINISESKGVLELSSIEFNWYDRLVITSNGIFLHKEHGQGKDILKYKNWEEFLKM